MASQPFDQNEFLGAYLPMRHNGWTDEQIADRIGISVKSLRNRATRCGVPFRPSADMYPDEDSIGDAANAMTVLVREEDPFAVHAGVVELCASHPRKVAQVIMALAAWVNVDEPMSVREERVREIAAPRSHRPVLAL